MNIPAIQMVGVDDVLRVQPGAPVATSRGRSWPGAIIDVHAPEPGVEVTNPALDHHVVIVGRTACGRMLQRGGGRTHECSLIVPGATLIMPAGNEAFWAGEWGASVRIRLSTQLLDDAAQQIGRKTLAELPNVFGKLDTTIDHLSRVLSDELERANHPTQALIIGAASCALAAHILGRYEVHGAKAIRAPANLGPAALARVICYIEENLDGSIDLADLAAQANVSRFHFAVLFKRSTGVSPMAYVERSRIQRAQSLIVEGTTPLVEIALALGFSDQSHFTRRFHLHVGCVPSVFARARGVRLPRKSLR